MLQSPPKLYMYVVSTILLVLSWFMLLGGWAFLVVFHHGPSWWKVIEILVVSHISGLALLFLTGSLWFGYYRRLIKYHRNFEMRSGNVHDLSYYKGYPQ